MANHLIGLRVAVLAADMVEHVELDRPRRALRAAAAEVELVSVHDGYIRSLDGFWPDAAFGVDRAVTDATAADYDALLLPGGAVSADRLRGHEGAVAFARAFFESGKPIAAIGHAVWLLIEAGVAAGRALTSRPTVQTDLRRAHAIWVDRPVVVAGNLVTSRDPQDLDAFNRAMIDVFASPHRRLRVAA